jgi:hypothetical protein
MRLAGQYGARPKIGKDPQRSHTRFHAGQTVIGLSF